MIEVTQQLIDISGVCERFKVAPRTVYRWFNSGLESSMFGGKRLTSMDALQRFGELSNERAELLRMVRDGKPTAKERDRGQEKATR
jgi:hypothetical protein